MLVWAAVHEKRLSSPGVLILSGPAKRHLHEQQLLPLTKTCEPTSFFHSARSNLSLQVPCSEIVAPFWTWCPTLSLQSKSLTVKRSLQQNPF